MELNKKIYCVKNALFINRLFAASGKKYDRTWISAKERKFLKNRVFNKISMILAKQRVIDINKSLAVPLAEREDIYRAYRRQKETQEEHQSLKTKRRNFK